MIYLLNLVFMYVRFSDELSVRRLDLNTGSVEIVEDEGDLIVAADFNRELERVFFVDNTQGKIRRTHINGLEVPVDFVTRDVQGAEGLSVDWVGRYASLAHSRNYFFFFFYFSIL